MIPRRSLALVVVSLSIASTAAVVSHFTLSAPEDDVTFAAGVLNQDETWSGLIHVTDIVVVPQGVTLIITPGTFVEFEHYRGYRKGKIGLSISGGTIKAIGTPEERIWFTSDADDPINGDWGGITCTDTNNSAFEYVIVEFAMIGIEQFGSAVNISHSIIRWMNTEGLYAERSHPTFEHNLIYGNAYHEIALEQYNYNVRIRFNIFGGGHFGIHCEATNVTIKGNYFVNYTGVAISGGQFSNLTIVENRFRNISGMNGDIIGLDTTSTSVTSGNDYGMGTVPIPDLGFEDIVPRPLGYIPGDSQDRFLYVYDNVDETRKVIGRLDNETTFGWSLTYANGSLWRFDHRSITVGQQQDFVKIDPSTGTRQLYGNNVLVNPRGLCYDGEFFWANDFTLHKIFRFKVNASNYIDIESSFPTPGAEKGGLGALATDGTYLYTPGGSMFNKIDKNGTVVEVIALQPQLFVGPTTWTGDYFWSASGMYWTKWYPNGTLAGVIYPPSWETIGLAWDGTYLWSVEKTCELWYDGKVFQIEVLDDQFLIPQMPITGLMIPMGLFLLARTLWFPSSGPRHGHK